MRARRLATLVSLATLAPMVALGALLLAPRPASAEKIADDDVLNYLLRIPEEWAWVDTNAPALTALHVVKGAERRLETLKDGKPGTGEGARLLLSVQDVAPALGLDPDFETWVRDLQILEERFRRMDPPSDEVKTALDAALEKVDKALLTFADKPETRALVMSRWGKDPKGWPAATTEGRVEIGGIPAVKIVVEAPCANLASTDAPCKAVQFVWVIRKRLYRLALWTWPTPRDRERLRDNIDEIEMTFEVPKTEAIPRKPDAKGPTAGDPSAKDKPEGDEATTREIKDLNFGFKVTKPRKFAARALDHSKSAERDTAFEFRAYDSGSDAIVDLLCYRIGRAGATAFDLNNYLTGLWSAFLKQHPEGPLATVPFQPYTDKLGFFVLPDPTKKKELKRPEAKDADKEVSRGEMERLGVCEEVKGVKIAGERVKETWRWCMFGNLARVGQDLQMHYTFSTNERTFVLRVTTRKDGYERFKAEILEILKTFTILEEPK